MITYTHTYNNEPTARSYYTAQLLNPTKLFRKSEQIHDVVQHIKDSNYDLIIVVWEHLEIPKMIHGLIGIQPDWEQHAKKVYKQLGKKYKQKNKHTLKVKNIIVKYCCNDLTKENEKVRGECSSPLKDVSFSLVWDINYNLKSP